MGQTNFHLTYSEDTIKASNHCARCGETAEIHLTLLGEPSQRGGSFCLQCGEALLHTLQNQYSPFGHPGSHRLDTTHSPSTHNTLHFDEGEGGIIFWEGHGWSSDGPFAGA